MTLAQRIFEEAQAMPEAKQQQVLEFMLFVKQRDQQLVEMEMDKIIQENIEALKVLAQ